ncbi:IS1096 element passenger TnpR family protein [Dolosicoccus paucivorans]|uniref:IS1096 element passenger TnpR family protein n=1 Tax=Dolosicoccus paucivorans TaxID=84521 RepID=UPI00089102D8|nr:hypothetical protein [Dolosicoccus paucivorans]SDI53326.1 pRiA4b ORF-3-like protein [Dolosicoccus paucivorans]
MKKITFVSELMGSKPRVWRRFEVYGTMSIQSFMDALMMMYRMDGRHLYHLEIPTKVNDFVQKHLNEEDKLTKPVPRDNYLFVQIYRPNFKESVFNVFYEKFGSYFPDEDEFEDDYECGYEMGSFMDALELRGVKKNNPLDSLETLNLRYKDCLEFHYDYGDDWRIRLDVEAIEPATSNADPTYLKIIRGRGEGILEDIGGIESLSQAYEADASLRKFNLKMMQEDVSESLEFQWQKTNK